MIGALGRKRKEEDALQFEIRVHLGYRVGALAELITIVTGDTSLSQASQVKGPIPGLAWRNHMLISESGDPGTSPLAKATVAYERFGISKLRCDLLHYGWNFSNVILDSVCRSLHIVGYSHDPGPCHCWRDQQPACGGNLHSASVDRQERVTGSRQHYPDAHLQYTACKY